MKIYSGPRDQDWRRDGKEGQERFWRNIFAGHAAVRFHRPPTGIGISAEALCQVRSARQLANRVDFFTLVPANELLKRRAANEAYCLANETKEVVLYFPGGGDISLDVPGGKYEMSRLSLETATWETPETVRLPGKVITGTNYPQVILLVSK